MSMTLPSSDAREKEFADRLVAASRQIFSFIFALVHNIPDAEDIFQQVSLALWEDYEKFDPQADFAAWACGIARHKSLDFLRRKYRDRHEFSPEFIDQLADRQTRQSNDQTEALQTCLAKLRAGDRRVIEACYQQGVSIKEAAESLGRPAGSVYDSLVRIRRSLWSCIQRTLAEERSA